MPRNHRKMFAKSLAPMLAALAMLAAAGTAPAATAVGGKAKCEGTINDARYIPESTEIFVQMKEPINSADLTAGGGRWSLADLSEIPVKNIPVLRAEPDNFGNTPTFTSIRLVIGEKLTEGHVYQLAALDLTILGCIPESRPTSGITFLKPGLGTRELRAQPKLEKSKGRDDSHVYIQGAIEGARGGKAQFSSDIKIDIPFKLQTKRDTWVGPYFNLKASTADDADANSLNMGGKLSVVVASPDSGFVRNVIWSPNVGLEADRRFDNVNGVVGNTIYFVTAGNENTFKWRIYFQPFVGYEIGRNFKSPVKSAEGRGISRLNAGGSLYFTVPLKNDKEFSIQADYIRRFLLRREFSFTEDDDKNLVLLNVGKGPRDYLKTNVQYDFAKFTALTLSYEYGRLPPNFELVNHKYSLGLLLKFKTKFGKQ